MKLIDFDAISITQGFWANKISMIADTTLMNVYNRFKETGRFDALKCKWQPGAPNRPHIFWDSDIAKWIESAAYILQKQRDEKLEALVDAAVQDIYDNRDENGYFNSYYLVCDKKLRWHNRTEHELYCAGHLIEAAVAYYKATGKTMLLEIVEDFTEYIYRVFVEEQSAGFVTPGHEEIELALVKLYKLTNKQKYLELSKFFIDRRGVAAEREYREGAHGYSQTHLPVRQQETAEGHSVRAVYLYSAMADLAKLCDDAALFDACDKIFDNIINRRMYITGGIGSTHMGEAFTSDYDLPTMTAYSESCAAIGLAFFAQRMLANKADSKYADAVERAMYNNILSSISLDGKSFFYTNPLEIRTDIVKGSPYCRDRQWLPQTTRKEVFDCSCCPPNISRFIASVGNYIYSTDKSTLYVHQYINSDAEFDSMRVTQKTDYPIKSDVSITVNGAEKIAVRIPYWCKSVEIKLNGQVADYEIKDGYAYTSLNGENVLDLSFSMPATYVYPSQRIRDCVGRIAVCRGPVVYCAEAVDNDFDIHTFVADTSKTPQEIFDDRLGMYKLQLEGFVAVDNGKLYDESIEYKPERITMIPYYAFANRGENDMTVFLAKTF